MPPHPLKTSKDIISTGKLPDSTYIGSFHLSYNPSMEKEIILDSTTKTVTDNRSKTVDAICVEHIGNSFDLILYHAVKLTGNHADEVEIVARWHFNDIEHLEFMNSLINKSVDNAKLESKK